MNAPSQDALVDLIYEAATEPDLWPRVMQATADAVGGGGVWLSQLNMRDGAGGGVIVRIDPASPALYAAHYAQRNPLFNVADPDAYLRAWRPRILTDEDWMSKSELMRSEYYNDFLKPQDIHSTVMIRLARAGDDIAALNINRTVRQSQYGSVELERLEDLHPHLIRAWRLGARFEGLGALEAGLAGALERSTNAIVLVAGDGRVAYANSAASRLLGAGRGVAISDGRLSVRGLAPRARLARLLADAARGERAVGGAMLYACDEGEGALAIAVAPARAARFAPHGAPLLVVVSITDPVARLAPSARVLRQLFDLTEAEARTGAAVGSGLDLAEAAATLGIAVNTVRTQLAGVFQKMGLRRQADLVRVVAQLASFRVD